MTTEALTLKLPQVVVPSDKRLWLMAILLLRLTNLVGFLGRSALAVIYGHWNTSPTAIGVTERRESRNVKVQSSKTQ